MAGPNISRDVTIRATLKNETDAGAKSVEKSMARMRDAEARAAAQSAKRMREAETKGSGHGGGHFSRVLSDQSTTGLDPLGRAGASILGDKLGVGLAFGGLAVGGKMMQDMSEKTLEWHHVLRQGKLDAYGVAVELGKSIPILGSFVSAGQNIREMLTNEKASLELQNEGLKARNEHMARYLEGSRRVADSLRDQSVTTEKIRRDMEGITRRGPEVERGALRDRLAEQKATLEAEKVAADRALKDDKGLKEAQAAKKAFEDSHGYELGNLEGEFSRQQSDPRYFMSLANAARLKELREEKSRLNEEEKSAAKLAKQNYENTKGNIDAQMKGAKRFADESLKEFNKRQAESLDNVARGNQNAAASGARAAEQGRLAVDGQVSEAALAGARGRAADARDAANLEADAALKNAGGDPALIASIEETRNRKIVDSWAKLATETAQIRKDAALESRKALHDQSRAEADAATSINAERLRIQGEGFAAERSERKRALDQRLADIDEDTRQQIARNKENAPALLAKAEADKTKAKAEFAGGERAAARDERQTRFGIARDLVGGEQDRLRSEARMGSIGAAVDAKRLEIVSEFAEKRQKLSEMTKDPNVTKAERDLAQMQLAGLDKQQEQALRMATFTGGATMPTLSLGGRTSGAAQKATEEGSAFIQLSREVKSSTEAHKKSAEAMESLVKVISGNPMLKELFAGYRPGR